MRLFARIWAALVLAAALISLAGGEWITGAFLIVHAVLVWPEAGDFAANRGKDGIRLIGVWGALIISLVLLGSGSTLDAGSRDTTLENVSARTDEVRAIPSPAPMTLESYRAKISGHAVSAIDRSDYYVSVFRALGAARVRDANALAPWVAMRVAFSPACDRVDMVEISQDANRGELRWFVDCLNRQRFYVSETDAAATRSRFSGVADTAVVELGSADLPLSQNARVGAFDEQAGLSLCETAVRGLLQVPDAYRPAGAASTTRHPQRGRATISRSFTVLDGSGVSVRSQWQCLLDAGDMRIIEIKWLDAGQWRLAAAG